LNSAAAPHLLAAMSTPAYKPATVADLLALPDDERVELVDGLLIRKPDISSKHFRAAQVLCDVIGGPYDDGDGGPGGWWVFTETLVSMSPQVYRPNIAGWRRTRLPDPDTGNPIEVVPDWCCEIVSPGNAAHDRVRKRLDYAAHGVSHYWLVDPEAGSGVIEALELDGRVWRECGAWGVADKEVRIPPFEAIPLDLSRIFLPA